MQWTKLLGVATVALVTSLASAHAQQQLQVGTLECEGGKNVGFVVGSATTLNCVFRSNGRPPEPYVASVRRFGLDLGFTEQTGLAWVVYAPTNRIGPGDLAGSYGGVGANASVGVGVGGNLLVGGSANSYSLQPLSLQGQTGFNVTAGIADVQLTPAGVGPAVRRGVRRHRYGSSHRVHHGHRSYRHHRRYR